MTDNEELSINQDLNFQHRMWKVERVGWAVIAAVLTAGTAGLFGHGPMSRITTKESASLVVAHERFGRYQAPEQLEFFLAADRSHENSLSLQINHEFLDKVQIGRIMPTPLEERATADGVMLVFPIIRQNGGRVHMTIMYQAEMIGDLPATFTLDDTTSVRIHQFIYP